MSARKWSSGMEGTQPSVRNEVSGTVAGSVIQASNLTIEYRERASLPPPRQLPAAPRTFVGRDHELEQMATALDEAAGEGGAMVISAVAGMGGIGKTWLALRWAHQHVSRFPDGQLYVNLRGFDPSSEPLSAAAAVRGFLQALGVESATIPTELDAQLGLYRSLVADKRMLIVLDNARNAAQVTPLLPGSAKCTVLVTSRDRMPGLVATHSARLVMLDVLDPDGAREILIRRLGRKRVAAEPEALAELLACCAGLPLALAIVAGRATAQRDLPLMTLASELRTVATRLTALDEADPTASLRSVLSWSYAALAPGYATLFGLLGLVPGPDIGVPAVASLASLPITKATAILRVLEKVSLVQERQPGRYRMHDLVRLYAGEQAHRDQSEEVRDAALKRLVDFYGRTAHNAARILFPHHPAVEVGPPVDGVHSVSIGDQSSAQVWLEVEHACALASQQTAVEHEWHTSVWQLACALDTFYRRQGNLSDALAAWRAGLPAAERHDNPAVRVLAHRGLGYTATLAGRHAEGLEHLGKAATLAETIGDLPGQAHAQRALAQAWGKQQHYEQALEHATRALALARALDDPVGEARALNNAGWYLAQLGHYQRAREHCTDALSLGRSLHHREVEGFTLDSLAYIAHHSNEYAEALDYYNQALAVMRELGHSYNEAQTLERLGHSYLATHKPNDAQTSFRQALELYQSQHRVAETDRVQRYLKRLKGQG